MDHRLTTALHISPYKHQHTQKLIMSDEFLRLKRVVKSIIPRFPKGRERQYNLGDARNMINELGMQMSPATLEALVSNDMILDDFLSSVYHLEYEIRRKVVTSFATIDADYNPRVYEEDNVVGFSVTHRGEELVFAEYDLSQDDF